ncbi:MAG: hypothetical protein A2Y88_07955 [Chloroflexi bacterium RBG_13_48_10]|nr:MAG: hypothetical protein A2Y88_07955 [Chloroflexi bacterium RBG_13_48_10]
MKKVLLIGLIVALALIIVGGAGVAYARIRGAETNTGLALTRYTNGGEVVRLYSYGPGNMMDEYRYGSCPGGTVQGYGPGGMMGGYANGSCPGDYRNGYGPGGMMQGYGPGAMMQGYGLGGMMGRRGLGVARGEGLMHEYMISAFAEAIDLTVEAVETRLADGESLKEIAIAQGITEDQLPDLLTQVHQAALDAAVADEVITQEQADIMLDHMNNYMGSGFGPGFGRGLDGCPMLDGDEFQKP